MALTAPAALARSRVTSRDAGDDRLSLLYEVSQILLAPSASIGATASAVFGVLARALDLRSGVLVLDCAARRRMDAWGSGEDLRYARVRARRAYRFLSGREIRWKGRATGRTSFLVLPLVVSGGRIFGAFQVEADRSLREPDVAFFNIVVNQLATEIARRSAIVAARVAERSRRLTAERAIRRRQDLLAMVSHDLRSPLNAILFVAQSLLRIPAAQDRRKGDRKKIEVIRRSVERMDRLIQDLLDVSSIEAGHFSVDVQATALAAIVRYTVDSLSTAAEANGVHLEVQVPPEDLVVVCDGARIIQVLSNIVGNAIKFTPRHGAVDIRAERRGDRVLLRVTDTGPGIARDLLPRVFDRYWQARETAAQGTGLGLYISKGIVEAHGETIGVEAELGRGSSFFFTLRRAG